MKNYLSHLNPKLDCLFQVHEKEEALTGDDKVWYCNTPLGVNILDSDVEINELLSRNPAPPHESLPQSNFNDRPLWQQLRDEAH